jgi:hypothetical protein
MRQKKYKKYLQCNLPFKPVIDTVCTNDMPNINILYIDDYIGCEDAFSLTKKTNLMKTILKSHIRKIYFRCHLCGKYKKFRLYLKNKVTFYKTIVHNIGMTIKNKPPKEDTLICLDSNCNCFPKFNKCSKMTTLEIIESKKKKISHEEFINLVFFHSKWQLDDRNRLIRSPIGKIN